MSPVSRRLRSQMVVLTLLVVLPTSMIAVNGIGALSALVAGREETTPTASTPQSEPTAKRSTPMLFGVYDPHGKFAADSSLEIRHEYLSWLDLRKDEVLARLRTHESLGIRPLITVEPWARQGGRKTLLNDIAQGRYNEQIDKLAIMLNELRGPVYISWGHEMDQDLNVRYPWSAQDPQQYIKAYRFVVDRLRKMVKNKLSLVWSGVLKSGSLKYWPGSAYADLVGMSLYSFPEWDRRNHGHIRDFRKIFKEKFAIVKSLSTPVLITEMGVAGSSDFESFWLQNAFDCFDDFPQIVGVVFFYAKDADGVWGNDIRTPDWRVHPDAIKGLVKWHQSQHD